MSDRNLFGDIVMTVLVMIGTLLGLVVTMAIGVVVSTVCLLGSYVVAFVRIEGARGDLPAGTFVRRPPPGQPGGALVTTDSRYRDPAVPDYFHRPVLDDAEATREAAWKTIQSLGENWLDTRGAMLHGSEDGPVAEPGWWFTTAIHGFGAGLAVGVLPGSVLTAGLMAVHHLTAGVLSVGWRAVGGVLRVVDSGVLQIRNARMYCVRCFRPMPYPAYDCPSCGATHWDIRPGPLGIHRRTCTCGRRMPTLLLLGSHRLTARCAVPACGAPLPYAPGTSRTEVLPLFGDTAAGKTRLMSALVVALADRDRHPGVVVEPGDPETRARIATLSSDIDVSRSTEPTPIALENGLVLEVTVRRRRLLHLFDVAGERFVSRDRSEELDYLRHGRVFVMVVDPLATPGFWASLPQVEADQLERHRTSVPSRTPDAVLHQAVDTIRNLGGRPDKSRLALVFSKLDVLGPTASLDVDGWIEGLGLTGLVVAARERFREVLIFRTAAIVDDGQVDPSIDPLLHWLLDKGLGLPRSPECRKAPTK